MNNFGGRRFLLVVGCGLVYTLLIVGGYIDQEVYRTLQIATVAAYIVGNGYQKNSENKYGSRTST